MLRFLVKPVLALSVFGLVASVLLHVTALLGYDLGLGASVFALHFGVFVVWFPVMLFAGKMVRGRRTSMWDVGGFMSWKHMFSGCPAWMVHFLYVLFAYVMLNFFLFMQTATHTMSGAADTSPQVLRGFSGHWLLFYYVAFAIAWSAMMKPELLGDAVCQKGHKALPGDKFCSECGSAVAMKRGG